MSPSILFMLWVSDVSAGEGASVALLPRASNILPPFLSNARHTHTDKHTHRQTHTHTHTQTHVQCIALWAAAQLERDTFLREPASALDASSCACLCLPPPPARLSPNLMFFSRTSPSAFDGQPGVAAGAKVFRLHVSNAHLTEI